MCYTRFASTLLFATVPMLAQAQGLIFSTDSLTSFASTPNMSIFTFAQRSQDPSGTSGFAVINLFNLSTGEFTQCVNADFAINVLPTGTTLSFVTTDEGSNCPVGEKVVVSCAVTGNTSILKGVTNGTAKLPVFQQQYTTHGVTNTYNNLTCQLSAFGLELVSDGADAGTSKSLTTP